MVVVPLHSFTTGGCRKHRQSWRHDYGPLTLADDLVGLNPEAMKSQEGAYQTMTVVLASSSGMTAALLWSPSPLEMWQWSQLLGCWRSIGRWCVLTGAGGRQRVS